MSEFPLLSFLTWLPIAGGLLVLAFGDRGIRAGRWVALAIAVATFIASIPLYTGFDSSTFAFQFREQLPWIPAFHATYYLGIDGIAVNGSANTVGFLSGVIRRVQSGFLYSYAFWMVIGLAAMLGWFLTRLE